MMNEAKVIIAIAVISCLGFFEIIVNAKKNYRIRQFPITILSVFLMAYGMYVWTTNMRAASEFCAVADFFVNADLLAANAILLLGYIVIRLALRPIIVFICKSPKMLGVFALDFYEYDDEYGEWFLRKQWINFRKYFLAIVWGTIIAAGIFLGITWVLGPGSVVWLLIYPGAAIAVITEIYNYINGQTKEEFEHSVIGDDADSRRISNYYKLREILEQILPDPMLSVHTGSEFVGIESSADLIEQMKESKDERDQITAEYFNIDGRYAIADVDCVQATLQMMHRKNVVFFNPFYRDLGLYITLPLVTTLLNGKKGIVLCGRKTAAEDIKSWLADLLREYSHMRSMWRVNYLSDKEPECEIGILTFTQIYDKNIINNNREFLNETDFVLLVEPSIMLNTSQIALSIITEEMQNNDEKPVYCVCDRNTDGLIDTLSHLLRTEITDVVAMPIPHCNYTVMSWNADGDFHRQQLFDKQTKYLGNGIELAAIAVKNQIPKVTWYSESKAPVKDIKWIAGQYYSTICRYMNQPVQQKNLYEKIEVESNLWESGVSKEQFIIVEDEFCNMFGMMRAYLSRGRNQAFVNVLSENYLLRDYMRCNQQMFMADPNAIPSLVPDYAKTERNTILKLIMMMVLRSVTDEEILKEFHLAGIETDDAFGTLSGLLNKYTFVENTIFTTHSARMNIDEFTTLTSCTYSISGEIFEKHFSDSLKNAYYILEDEKNEEGYIDAKLFSHVAQTILPGQFVTYDGKYYIVKHISPQSGVVLRRASNLFDSRKYYRQIRTYRFSECSASEVVFAKKIGDIEFSELRMDFQVDTTGYLEMNDSHNLRTARVIDFSDDPAVSNYVRKYHNKSILCIKLPDSDEKIRFTICMLLAEVFKSVFPEGWPYITAVTKRPEGIDGMLNYMVYQIEGGNVDSYIYIIEDSDIDLGLLNAVEKNFMKFMEIIADFLEWHFEKMREPASKDPVPVKISIAEAQEKKQRSLVVKMLDRIRKLFGGKKEEEIKLIDESQKDVSKENRAEESAVHELVEMESTYDLDHDAEEDAAGKSPVIAPVAESNIEEYALDNLSDIEQTQITNTVTVQTGSQYFEEQQRNMEHPEDELELIENADPDLVHIDGTDIFDNEGIPEDNDYLELSFAEMGLSPLTKSRYQRECFLKFGFEEIDGRIQIDEVRKYLRVRGWSNNSLTLARKRDVFAKNQLDTNAMNQCDFCGLPLSGVSYDRLNDGRVRCNNCSSSAITDVGDFKGLFYRTLDMMEDFFGVRYKVPISVKMVDARTIAKGAGMVFRPSTKVANRILGFAQRKGEKYSLLIENGSPRLVTIDNIVHELTHIWQYVNWNDKEIASIYQMGKKSCTSIAKDIVYEGMAMWVSVQYLYQIGETYYAAQQEAMAEMRQDAYGAGFRLYAEQYPLVKDSSLLRNTPFSAFPTLEPELVKSAVKGKCTEDQCLC